MTYSSSVSIDIVTIPFLPFTSKQRPLKHQAITTANTRLGPRPSQGDKYPPRPSNPVTNKPTGIERETSVQAVERGTYSLSLSAKATQ